MERKFRCESIWDGNPTHTKTTLRAVAFPPHHQRSNTCARLQRTPYLFSCIWEWRIFIKMQNLCGPTHFIKNSANSMSIFAFKYIIERNFGSYLGEEEKQIQWILIWLKESRWTWWTSHAVWISFCEEYFPRVLHFMRSYIEAINMHVDRLFQTSCSYTDFNWTLPRIWQNIK